MRIQFKYLKKIEKWYGSSDFEIGYGFDGLTIRFGYWRQVDMEELSNIIPDYFILTENLVDDDDDCGPLYDYKINR